jgi:hypothetical protein
MTVNLPKLARMQQRHDIPDLPDPLVVEWDDRELHVALPEGKAASFRPTREPGLSSRRAAEIAAVAGNDRSPRLFVLFRRSSPEARAILRDAEVSFAGDDGHVFVRAPGIYVERGDLTPPRGSDVPPVDLGPTTEIRNPFAIRSSRVPRWMLNHADEQFSPSSLAKNVALNPAAISRILTSLEDAAVIREATSAPQRGRSRVVELTRPLALLEEWLPLWQRRRIQRRRWDIGAHDVAEALRILRTIDDRDGWALGGLVGASTVSRAVEPAVVTLWAGPEAVERLAGALTPVESRGGRGTVEVSLVPDPWTLELARTVDALPIADPVQLWLDCAAEGERALEAADAVAQVMSWS